MLQRLPTWLRATVITSGQSLIGGVLAVVVSLLFDVQQWISDPTNRVDISGAGTAFVLLLFTFCTAVVTAIQRRLQPPENTYPEPPQPPAP
jgi:hypothetical protein